MKLVPKGNRIVITGGAKGFGKAMALCFAKANWRILIADLQPDHAQSVIDELIAAGAQDAYFTQCDITKSEDILKLYNCCMELWDGIDVLINNAGIYCGGTFAELTEDNWAPVIETNLIGTMRVTKQFIETFQKQKSGRIVNISSLSGVLPMPGSSAYSISKAGVFAFSQTLRHELRPYKVGITVAVPNIFPTDIFKDGDIPNPAIRNSMESTMHVSPVTAEDVAQRVYDAVMNDQYMVTTDEGLDYDRYLDMLDKNLEKFTGDMAAVSKSMKNKVAKPRTKIKSRETA